MTRRALSPRQRVRYGAVVAATALLVASTLHVAFSQREPPARCSPPLQPMAARCCAPGQHVEAGACRGTAEQCPDPLLLVEGQCVLPPGRVHVAGGTVHVGAGDWEGQTTDSVRDVTAGELWLDAHEVTAAQWMACVQVQHREPLTELEPGIPVTNVTPEAAERFCASVGGRLPTQDEWVIAAATSQALRFPWGPTGLVCRRAAFGLADGPCAQGGSLADIAGSRPAGQTESGLLDMAGNVAELAKSGAGYVAMGGSFRSTVAAQLKSWAREPFGGARDDVGFRCAYDRPQPTP